MNKFRKAYGKSHMGAADLLKGKTTNLTIAGAYWQPMKDFKSGEEIDKIVLDFEGDWPPLVVPVPVARVVAPVWGEDIKSWVGRMLPLYPTKIEIRGEMIDVIRCDVDGLENDDDIEAMDSPRNTPPQHPSEQLYAAGKKGNGKKAAGKKDAGMPEDIENEKGWQAGNL